MFERGILSKGYLRRRHVDVHLRDPILHHASLEEDLKKYANAKTYVENDVENKVHTVEDLGFEKEVLTQKKKASVFQRGVEVSDTCERPGAWIELFWDVSDRCC